MDAVQMVCDNCESPLNLIKARKRHVRKFGAQPAGMRLGLCVCGAYVIDKDYYRRMYEAEKKEEEKERSDILAKAVSIAA